METSPQSVTIPTVSPGQTRNKPVAYLSKADCDTSAKSTDAGVKWIKLRYLINLFANMLPWRAALMGSQ